MGRVILGLLKGGIVGAALGFGAFKIGLGAGAFAYVVYGAIGFAVGLVCGKPLWRQETLWTPVVKGVFGFLIAMGLAWVGRKALGGLVLPMPAALQVPEGRALGTLPFVLGPLIGILYGVFVEVDDGGKADAQSGSKAPAKAPPKTKPASS